MQAVKNTFWTFLYHSWVLLDWQHKGLDIYFRTGLNIFKYIHGNSVVPCSNSIDFSISLHGKVKVIYCYFIILKIE